MADKYFTKTQRSFNPLTCMDRACKRKIYCESSNVAWFETTQCKGEEPYDFKNDFFGSLIARFQEPYVEKIMK